MWEHGLKQGPKLSGIQNIDLVLNVINGRQIYLAYLKIASL
jgi:hypothetical protein